MSIRTGLQGKELEGLERDHKGYRLAHQVPHCWDLTENCIHKEQTTTVS